SNKMSAQDQAREMGRAWERLPEKPRRQVTLKIVSDEGEQKVTVLGAHPPNMNEDDLGLIHEIWLQVSNIPSRQKVRHRDVVRVALNRLKRDLRGHSDAMLDFYKLEQENGKKGFMKNNEKDV